MTRKTIAMLLCLVGLVSYCTISTHLKSIPPSDAECIKQFNDYRSDFEKLHEMLEQDKNISTVANFGISTTGHPGVIKPEEMGFPTKRYEDYLALFNKAGVIIAESSDNRREFAFHIFHSPGGALGLHLTTAIVWKEDVPENQIANSDEYWDKPSGGKPAYRPIEGKWYLLMRAP